MKGQKEWKGPYVAGGAIGLLLALLFLVGERFGTSTGVAKIGALVESLIVPSGVSLWEKISRVSLFDWTILFVIGIFLGSFVSANVVYKSRKIELSTWNYRFGSSRLKKWGISFLGGAFLLIGARIADGCTSGHVITGGSQFSITSFVFMIALFAVGIPVAHWVYKR